MFKELFDAVIDEKHGGFKAADKHPAPDLDAGKVLSTQTHTLETAAESRGAL